MAVVLGPIDTDMNRGFENTEGLARVRRRSASLMGWKNGEDEIFPDPRVSVHRRGTGAPAQSRRSSASFAAFGAGGERGKFCDDVCELGQKKSGKENRR